MHPLIYLPEGQTLQSAGLTDHAEGAENCGRIPTGPDGGSGLLYWWRSPGVNYDIGFRPDSQTWIPAVPRGDLAAGRYWVGIERNATPEPIELQRRSGVDGYRVRLGDGHEWIIPAARYCPQDVRLASDGGIELQVQDKYREFWDGSLRWVELLLSIEEGQTALQIGPQEWGYLTLALSINYRITPELASELRLFSTSNVLHVVQATIDGQLAALVEQQKKSTETVSTPVI